MARKGYVEVGEAAKQLGITRQGVHHRIKAGRYRAELLQQETKSWYEIPIEDLRQDLDSALPVEPSHEVVEQRTYVLAELLEAIKANVTEAREDLTRVLEKQVDAKDQQISNMEERTRKLEAELEEARGKLEEARQPWWRRLFE